MKFAYIAAALIPLAFASPIALDAPNEDGLTSIDARDNDGLTLLSARDEDDHVLLEERDEEVDLLSAFDDMFSAIEDRSAEFDDGIEEEETEIEARSTGSILSGLKRIRRDISGVNRALGKFGNNQPPSNGQALAVQRAAAKLANDVKAAARKTKASKKLSKRGTKKVFKYVSRSIKPATLGSLQNFIQHAPGFKKAGFGSLVKSRLGALKGNVDSLGHALITKAGSKGIKKKGKKIIGVINRKFNQAISRY